MIILEIFIGLVLVYFLYSLFASIITERISLFIGMRARVLRQGINSFMNDEHAREDINLNDFNRWIKDLFIVEPKDFKYSKAGEFYNEPTIKYLAKIGNNNMYSSVDTKPSYISKENFLLTILNLLSKNSKGINEWEKIKFAIKENSLHLEPQTLQMFQDWIERSNDSYVNFKNLMVDHFEDSMDRVNGWYKKKVRHILLIVGIFLCLIFNVDTFQILEVLSNDPDKRSEMVQLAIAATEAENKYFNDQESAIPANNDTVTNLNIEQQDSINQINLDRVKTSYDETHSSIKNTISVLGTGWEIPHELDTVVIEVKDENELKKYFDVNKEFKKNNSISEFNNKFKIDLHSIQSYAETGKPSMYSIYGKSDPSTLTQLIFVADASLPWKKKFWGFMITAFALTLGAQFWFDLLKRLISIRGVGEKPEEKKINPRNDKATILTTDGLKPLTSDPVQIAYLNNLGSWEKMEGFVSANIAVNEKNERCIKIISEPGKSLTQLGREVIVEIKETNISVPLVFANGTKGSLGNGNTTNPYAIRQESSAKGWGALAGMVYYPKLGKNVALTCGHVVRYEKSPFLNLGNKKMIYQKPKTNSAPTVEANFGDVENLVLSSFCDAGIISLANGVDSTSFRKIETTRPLTTSDEGRTNVAILNYENRELIKDNKTPAIGTVINTGMYYSFNDFPSNTKRYYNLFMMKGEDDTRISDPGDSGSLIVTIEKDQAGNVINEAKEVAVGLLVGGADINGKPYSFGINITDVFEILQIEKYNPSI
jgi:hypothetical protein